MGDSFVIFGLRRKRARLAGEIEAEDARQAKRREALATLDAVIRMFEPASNPELIAPIRPVSSHNVFFKRGEQMRLCVAALRDARRPVPCRAVVDFCLTAKGLGDLEPGVRAVVTEHIRTALSRLAGKGAVRKVLAHPETWWELAG